MHAASIRVAEDADLEALTRLYNHYVIHTAVTFDMEPYTPERRRPWLAQFSPGTRHQLFVAERDGDVVGYAGSMPFRPKAAYETSVEATIYLEPSAQREGLGGRLYETLFASLAGHDVHRVLAGITLPNEASLALHRRFGFSEIGVMREVGRKHGRYWDVVWLDRGM